MQKKLIIIGIAALGALLSCTKLDTNPYSVIPDSAYKPTIGEIGAKYLAPAYRKLHAITGTNQSYSIGDVYQAQAFTSDEAITPHRYPDDWWDNGHFYAMFTHNWNSNLADLPTLWAFAYGVVSIANENVYDIQQYFGNKPDVIKPFIDELSVIRSYGYYFLIDLFGNVPISTSYDPNHAQVANNTDFQIGRTALFDTIVNTVNKALPSLSRKNDLTTYATFNKWAAYALLAKMYINAEEWTGTAMWNECITACDSIINSGIYSLEPNYFTNFKVLNQGSKENIMVVDYTPTSTEETEGFYLMSLHYESNLVYNTTRAPWNGFCAMPDFYHSFDTIDKRLAGWSVGPQIAKLTGAPTHLDRAPYLGRVPVIFTADFIDSYWKAAGDTAPFRGDTLNALMTLENTGARLVKYEIEDGLPYDCLGVPLPLFRYSDILLLKAEALMRLNGGNANADALALVNQVRKRAGVSQYTSLNLTELLAERGRELYYEGIRRQDLIRFHAFVGGKWGHNCVGNYQDYWYDRTGEDPKVKVFPIPFSQITLNPSLTQNKGY